METRDVTLLWIHATRDVLELCQLLLARPDASLSRLEASSLFQAFDDAEAACAAAIKLKQTVKGRNVDARFSVTQGEVTLAGKDVLGDPILLGRALAANASPLEILIPENVLHQLKALQSKAVPRGERRFTGLERGIRVYSLDSAPTPSQPLVPIPESPSISSAKTPSEMFDFSRVEHERIQEMSEIQATVAQRAPVDIPLSLKNETITSPQAPVVSGGATVRRSYPLRGRNLTKDLGWVVGLWIIGLPGIILGIWITCGSYLVSLEQERRESDAKLSQMITESEVLKSLKRDRSLEASAVEEPEKKATPAPGTLLLRSIPPRAEVWINGQKLKSLTPVRVQEVPTRTSVSVEFRKSGFEDAVQMLNMDPGENRELEVELTRNR